MADYVTVLSRAVAALGENTPAKRHMLYGKARAALMRQLEGLKDSVSRDQMREQVASLDRAIETIEAGYREPEAEPQPEPAWEPEPAAQPEPVMDPEPAPPSERAMQPEARPEPEFAPEPEPEPVFEPEPEFTPAPEPEPEPIAEPEPADAWSAEPPPLAAEPWQEDPEEGEEGAYASVLQAEEAYEAFDAYDAPYREDVAPQAEAGGGTGLLTEPDADLDTEPVPPEDAEPGDEDDLEDWFADAEPHPAEPAEEDVLSAAVDDARREEEEGQAAAAAPPVLGATGPASDAEAERALDRLLVATADLRAQSADDVPEPAPAMVAPARGRADLDLEQVAREALADLPPRAAPAYNPDFDFDLDDGRPRRSWAGLLVALLLIAVLGVGAGYAYVNRDTLVPQFQALLGDARSPQSVVELPKIEERVAPIAGPGMPAVPGAEPAAPPAVAPRSVAPVAVTATGTQDALLYEEAAGENGSDIMHRGRIDWSLETDTSAGAGPETVIRGTADFPSRDLQAAITIRRNLDQALPASHTIEIVFDTPPDFPFGEVGSIGGILMKPSEPEQGQPLAGAAARVTSGFFLVGLSGLPEDLQRNVALLQERSWIDVPILYTNGKRAILSVAKGEDGEQAFSEAFEAWGE
jgi:hypothetical protein